MKKKELKSLFQNAKEIRCLSDNKIYNLEGVEWKFDFFAWKEDMIYIDLVEKQYHCDAILIYNGNETAEIISTLEPSYQIF